MSGFHNILKTILFLGTAVDVLIGIGCFIVGKSMNDMDDRLLMMDSVRDMKPSVVIAICVLGGITILSGLLGFVGFMKRIKCLEVQFIFLNFFFMLAFGALFAVNVYGRKYIDDQIPVGEGCATSALKSSNDVFLDAKQVWCQSFNTGTLVGCPCNITDKSKWSSEDQTTLNNPLNYNGINMSGTSNLQSCTAFIATQGNKHDNEIAFLQAVEETFQCTGVCDSDIVFYFSDVNNGPPVKMGCYEAVRNKLFDWLAVVYIYTIIAAVFTMLSVAFGNNQSFIFISYKVLTLNFRDKYPNRL